jgi:hypothetical protein
MNFIDKQQLLRKKVVDFGRRNNQDKLYSMSIDDLIERINFKSELTLKDIENAVYYPTWYFKNGNEEGILEGHGSVLAAWRAIKSQEKAIDRIEGLYRKSPYEMSPAEMQQKAIELFLMPFQIYKEKLSHIGLGIVARHKKDHYPPQFDEDGHILLGMVRGLYGVDIDMSGLVGLTRKIDLGLSDFHESFIDEMQYYANLTMNRMKRDVYEAHRFRYAVLNVLDAAKCSLAKHIQVTDRLSKRDILPKPKQIHKRLSLDMDIFALDFLADGKLVAMGQWGKSKDYFDFNLRLEKFDIDSGLKLSSRYTDLPVGFDGHMLQLTNFKGSLSIGSNGVIYAVGVNAVQRFTQDLALIDDNSDRFQDAMQTLGRYGLHLDSSFAAQESLHARHTFGSPTLIPLEESFPESMLRIFQVTEHDEILYFLLQGRGSHAEEGINYLIATDGDRIKGEPMSLNRFGYDRNPRMVVSGSDLYVKVNGKIGVVDRSLSSSAAKCSFLAVDGLKEAFGYIPPNFCVGKNGMIWMVPKFSDEIIPSIKGYHQGDYITSFHDLPLEGNHDLRAMAIDAKGLLAYSNPRKGVNFYEVPSISQIHSNNNPSLASF